MCVVKVQLQGKPETKATLAEIVKQLRVGDILEVVEV